MDSMKGSTVTEGCPYVDHASDEEDDDQQFQGWQQQEQQERISKGPLSSSVGAPEELPKGQNEKDESVVTFPVKLHDLLEKVDQHGLSHGSSAYTLIVFWMQIIGWAPHGRCFLIHKKNEFTDYILPRWFRQTQFSSFQRQLNIYHFKRITKGPDKGAYYHELFLRGRQFLCYRMQRQQVKGIRKGRHKAEVETEPDFYAMKPCKSDANGSAPVAGQHTATSPMAVAAAAAAAADDSRTAAINNHVAKQKNKGEPLEAFENGTAAKNAVSSGIMNPQALMYFQMLLQANIDNAVSQAMMLQNLQQASSGPVNNTIPGTPNMGAMIQSILQPNPQAELSTNRSTANQLVSALCSNSKGNDSSYVMRADALQQAQLSAMRQAAPNAFFNVMRQQNSAPTNQQPPTALGAYRQLQQQVSEATHPTAALHENVSSKDGLHMGQVAVCVSEFGTASNSGSDTQGTEGLDNSSRTPLDSTASLPLSYLTSNVSNASDRSMHFAAGGGDMFTNDAQKLETSQMNTLLQSLQDFSNSMQVQNNYGNSNMNCRSSMTPSSGRNAVLESRTHKSQRTHGRTSKREDGGLLLGGVDLEPRPFREDSGI